MRMERDDSNLAIAKQRHRDVDNLGSRMVHAVFLRNEHGIKPNHIMNAIVVGSGAADAFRVHGEARVVEQG